MPTRWASTKFRIRAEIGDVEFEHVVHFTSTHEPNNIPRAKLGVPVGRGFKGNESVAATIHRNINELRIQQTAKVYLKVEKLGASPGDSEDWPDDEFVIFDGFAVGTGWQRTATGAKFVIHLLHWLSDLHYSSSISATSHPVNPNDLGFDAAHTEFAPGAQGAVQPLWSVISGGTQFANGGNITTDLWGKVLQPWMEVVAKQDRINKDQLPVGNVKNDSALKALQRIAPAQDNDCHVPSALEEKGANAEVIADSIKMALLRETFDSWAHTTLWSKLVGEWVPSYFLGLVPRVEDALVVPFVPGLQEAFENKILAKDYDQSSLQAAMPRVPRAVGIFHSIKMWLGAHGGPGDARSANNALAGYFEGGPEDGLVILKEPPRWLSDDIIAWQKSRDAAGAEDGKVVGTADAPDVGDDEKEPKADDTHQSLTPLIDAYAQQWFILEMLKGRSGSLSGKLRFDIAPYSNIRIETLGEQFIPGDDLGEPVYGTVMRVTTSINAEASRAGTAFAIAHIRTEAENNDDKTSIDKPPFYKDKFTGCSLIDGF